MRSRCVSQGVVALLMMAVQAAHPPPSAPQEWRSEPRWPSCALFCESFESGDCSAWSAAVPCCNIELAELFHPSLVVVLDRSGSMMSLWPLVSIELVEFCQDARNDGTQLGLNFFPPNGSVVDACDTGHYDPPQVPANVPPPLLGAPTGCVELSTALDATSPFGGTPTSGALLGSLDFAVDHQLLNPQENVAVVLLTDGAPTSCETDINSIASIAAAAFNGVAEVETFTVTLPGANASNLDSIAAAGGTTASYDLTTNVDSLAAALTEIRSRVVGCRFDVSHLPPLDPSTTSLVYHPGDGGPALPLPRVSMQIECGGSVSWYLDDILNPGEILLCPDACDLVVADTGSRLELVGGCPQ